MFGKKRTENVVLTLSEFKALQWQSAMLHAIINASPTARGAVVEAVISSVAERKGGGQK